MTTGTEGNDTLQNDERNDHIDARGGDDTINLVKWPSSGGVTFFGDITAVVDGGTGFDVINVEEGNLTFAQPGRFHVNYGRHANLTVDFVNVERLVMTGRYFTDQWLTFGDEQNRITITGTGGAPLKLDTGGGDDQVVVTGIHNSGSEILVGSGNDSVDLSNRSSEATFFVSGGDGHDRLVGSSAPDVLSGGAGNDVLDGRGGRDTLAGGAGDDHYIVDTETTIVEGAGFGFDLAFARSSYSLQPGVSVELLGTLDYTLTATLHLAGNEFNNLIIGNNGSNSLSGLSGDDYLIGLEGDDHLDGGAGIDFMVGGPGNDIYYVDTPFDTVREEANEGAFDYIFTSVSYQLAAGNSIELLATTNYVLTTPINLTGNELNNAITGNNGDNWLDGAAGDDYLTGLQGNDRLDGGTGSDFMVGGVGNDSYIVDSSGDTVQEADGEGFDYVYASASYTLGAGSYVEVLGTTNAAGTGAIDLTGNELNNLVIGNEGANQLSGGAGDDYLQGLGSNDVLDGGAGQDFLEGGAGADTFRFASASHSVLGAADTLGDFQPGVDKIDLLLIDADTNTAGDQAFTFVGTAAFSNKSGELRYDVVGNQIHIYGDTDGNGLADLHIVAYAPTVAAGDFVL